MNKELKAFNKICKNLNSYEFTDEYKKGKKLIKEALKDKKKKDKFVKLVMQWLDNGHDITKILKDIENSESYGDFINLYPFAPKDEYDLLKEVLHE